MMKIAIIGVGALGCLFAARLSSVSEVIMLGNWQEQLVAINKGLQLVQPTGQKKTVQVVATNDIAKVPSVDIVFVLVKSYQTTVAAKQASKVLNRNSDIGIVLTLQNGAHNLEKLSQFLEDKHILAGVTTQAAKIEQPGLVLDTGPGFICLANPPMIADKVQLLSNLLTSCGWNVQLKEDINSLIWEKLAINTAINPLTTILNQKNGYLAEHTTARKLMTLLAQETIQVAKAQGFTISYEDKLEKHIIDIAKTTRNNTSSMLQDAIRGAQTEIDAICGAVIQKGQEHQIPTPINEIAYNLVKKIEQKQNKPGDVDIQSLLNLFWI